MNNLNKHGYPVPTVLAALALAILLGFALSGVLMMFLALCPLH
jgi:hypothetical protein